MCSRLGCLAAHKVDAANGLSVNGVIKIGLQRKIKAACVNQGRFGSFVCTLVLEFLCVCSCSVFLLLLKAADSCTGVGGDGARFC